MVNSNQSPALTIVTVVKDNIEGLKQTVASIEKQNYLNVEHVVVDGSSTDGTKEWLEEYKPRYSVKFISELDDGIYDAMNKGIHLASGNYVQFLNGGDSLINEDVLQQVELSWVEHNWDWAYGGIRYIDADRHPIREYNLRPFNRKRVSRGLGFVPHPATYASRELLIRLEGFDKKFGFSADQELAIRMSKNSKPYELAQVLVNYLIVGAHGESSFYATARRYQKIRAENSLRVMNSPLLDEIYTRILAINWSIRPLLRNHLESLKQKLSRSQGSSSRGVGERTDV